MAGFFKFIANMFTAKCCGCGAKATNFPHGTPCCDKCFHEVDCNCWLGYECDCGKEIIDA